LFRATITSISSTTQSSPVKTGASKVNNFYELLIKIKDERKKWKRMDGRQDGNGAKEVEGSCLSIRTS
jgi:hypothetical protein